MVLKDVSACSCPESGGANRIVQKRLHLDHEIVDTACCSQQPRHAVPDALRLTPRIA